MERIRKRKFVHRNRSGGEQFEALVAYMEEHSEFARAHITNLGAAGHDKYKAMWVKLAKVLNSRGPAQKDSAGWANTWRYIRCEAKKKKAAYTTAMRRTGNEASIEPLSQLHQQVTQVFGKYGTGLCLLSEVGIKRMPHNITKPDQPATAISSDDIITDDLDEELHFEAQLLQCVISTIPECWQQDNENMMHEIMWNFETSILGSLRLLLSRKVFSFGVVGHRLSLSRPASDGLEKVLAGESKDTPNTLKVCGARGTVISKTVIRFNIDMKGALNRL